MGATIDVAKMNQRFVHGSVAIAREQSASFDALDTTFFNIGQYLCFVDGYAICLF